MKLNPQYISKTRYVCGLQCHKYLWILYNDAGIIPPVDEATQATLEQGRVVGKLAQQLFPGGIVIDGDPGDYSSLLAQSGAALRLRRPIFEGTFGHRQGLARADILEPVGEDEWDLIEVKSSLSVKPEYIEDVAFQQWIYEGAGLKIRNCYVLYLNGQYVRRGLLDPMKLFVKEDVSKRVADVTGIDRRLQRMAEIIESPKYPDIAIGPHCFGPHDCPLFPVCGAFLPKHNPLTLYRRHYQKRFELIHRGILGIENIPDDHDLTDSQRIQVDAVRSGQPFIDRHEIKDFLSTLSYPLAFLDFETIGTAIPIYDLVSPYEQVPFQYSLHLVRAEGELATHSTFLSDGTADPRPVILGQLRRLLGRKGSIIAYNASFEKSVLKSSCEAYPEHAAWYGRIEPRILDLRHPFQSFHYYHPDQVGSSSLKAVLPLLTGRTYAGMGISDGGMASREFLRITFEKVSDEERERVRTQLEEYCRMDTLGMVEIVGRLKNLVA